MKILKTLKDVTKEVNGIQKEVEKSYIWNLGCSYFFANGVDVKITDNEFVILDGTDKEYQDFFIKCESNDYEYKVYVDDLEKWQKCRVIGVSVNGEDLRRMTVITETGTQLNRICKFVCDEEDCIADRCVYFWDKEID